MVAVTPVDVAVEEVVPFVVVADVAIVEMTLEELLLAVTVDEEEVYPIAPGRDVLMQEHAEAR